MTTDAALLEKVLGPQDQPPLIQRPDYQHVAAAWEQIGGKNAGLRMFSRLSEDVRVTYEMWKSNQLEKAHGIYSRLLTKWAKNGAMPLDGRKLPITRTSASTSGRWASKARRMGRAGISSDLRSNHKPYLHVRRAACGAGA